MPRNQQIPVEFANYDRDLILRDAQGVVTETFDHRTAVSSVSPTASGQQRANIAAVLAGDVINSLGIYCDTPAGTGVTLFKLGIWDANGKLLGQTADLTASLATQTWISAPLVNPVTIPSNGLVHLGFVVVYTTTAPSFRGSQNPGNNWMKLPNNFQFGLTIGGMADIGNFTAPPATGTQSYYVVAW